MVLWPNAIGPVTCLWSRKHGLDHLNLELLGPCSRWTCDRVHLLQFGVEWSLKVGLVPLDRGAHGTCHETPRLHPGLSGKLSYGP